MEPDRVTGITLISNFDPRNIIMSTVHTVPANTMATALIAAQVTQGTNYYDLDEHLDELLQQDDLKSAVLSSLAWYVDMSCVNKARNVLFNLYDHATETTTIDSFNEFLARISEVDMGEKIAEMMTGATNGSYTTLKQMLAYSVTCHDAAARSLPNAGTYAPPSLEELLAKEKPMKLDVISQDNLKILAKTAADGDAALEAIVFERMVKQQNARLQDRFEFRQKTNPAVMRVINEAQRTMVDTTCAFRDLDLDDQRRLIQSAANTIDRTLENLATQRRITSITYASIVTEGYRAKKEIVKVLKSPKFLEQ